jgi:Pentapeptide repeats (8 copies)
VAFLRRETARRAGGRGGGYALAAPMAERLTAEVASSPLQTGASMANDEHVALLKQGVAAWNAWRAENRNIRPNLSGAHLSEENLRGADLSTAILRGAVLRAAKLGKANLRLANLSETDLRWANLSKAKLGKATLSKANLSLTNLSGANLCQANLGGVNLERANLRGADLSGANLWSATLVGTDLTGADLTGCHIYGVSAWGLKLDGVKQQDLVITPADKPKITVDNIEVAQFIYLMLNNQKVCEVIDTITSKAVLILGRFTDERKAVLDALRDELRKRNYLPILFDFDKPTSRTTDETITLLARMSRFVIADISDAKSVLQELRAIVPDLPSVPVQPVITATQEEPGMFDFFHNFRSFLKVHHYSNQQHLIADLGERVIGPAEKWRSVREGAAGQTG